MKNLEQIRERYLREPFKRRLGHLASDLARISAFLENSINTKAVEDLLEESKFFIEWTTPDAPADVRNLLAKMQSKLALYQLRLLRRNGDSMELEELRKTTRDWSEHLVEISGLLST